MDAKSQENISAFEHHRLRLEATIQQFYKMLQQWQTWEVEYEGLKEEIAGVAGEPTREELVPQTLFLDSQFELY